MKSISIYAATVLLSTGLFTTQALADLHEDNFIQVNNWGKVFRTNDEDPDSHGFEWAIYTEAFYDPNTISDNNRWQVWNSYADGNIIDFDITTKNAANALNSLNVDNLGDIYLAGGAVSIDRSADNVGIGIAIPAQDLHIVSTAKRKVKSGYAADAYIKLDTAEGVEWTIGAQWSEFTPTTGKPFIIKKFVISDNDSSTIPFSIDTEASTDTLHLSSTSNVGIGTSAPAAKLDVNGTINSNDVISSTFNAESTKDVTELVALSVNNTDTALMSDAGFKLTNAKEGVDWTFRTLEDDDLMPSDVHNGFAISKKASGAKEMVLTGVDSTGGMELILGNGAKNTGGTWVNASSRSLKENIETLDTQAALQAFSKLQPVTYNYKINKDEKFVGFIAEDVPELVAMNSRDGLSSMDMVAVLTKVVQEQDKVMAETRAELKTAQEKIAKLETMQKRLAKVESLLTNLALDTSNMKTEKVSLNK